MAVVYCDWCLEAFPVMEILYNSFKKKWRFNEWSCANIWSIFFSFTPQMVFLLRASALDQVQIWVGHIYFDADFVCVCRKSSVSRRTRASRVTWQPRVRSWISRTPTPIRSSTEVWTTAPALEPATSCVFPSRMRTTVNETMTMKHAQKTVVLKHLKDAAHQRPEVSNKQVPPG